MPITLPNGKFFGTLWAIDPRPARLGSPEVIGMFRLFADLIAFHIEAAEVLSENEARLLAEREVSELREQGIGRLGHDLRNPPGTISNARPCCAGCARSRPVRSGENDGAECDADVGIDR